MNNLFCLKPANFFYENVGEPVSLFLNVSRLSSVQAFLNELSSVEYWGEGEAIAPSPPCLTAILHSTRSVRK